MSNPKQPENKVYIAYGSNLNLPQMAHRCPTAVTLATSEIKDYELVFRGSKTGSYATIEPCEGSTVPVLLWEIQPRDEFSLDIYEGYPDFYQKQLMDVPIGDGTIRAMVYTMPDHHQLGMPSQRYIDTIEEGYASAGFDTDVLYDAIEKTEQRIAEQEQEEASFSQQWC